jgi:hypothetical protein
VPGGRTDAHCPTSGLHKAVPNMPQLPSHQLPVDDDPDIGQMPAVGARILLRSQEDSLDAGPERGTAPPDGRPLRQRGGSWRPRRRTGWAPVGRPLSGSAPRKIRSCQLFGPRWQIDQRQREKVMAHGQPMVMSGPTRATRSPVQPLELRLLELSCRHSNPDRLRRDLGELIRLL